MLTSQFKNIHLTDTSIRAAVLYKIYQVRTKNAVCLSKNRGMIQRGT
jgi:hypothetical protein